MTVTLYHRTGEGWERTVLPDVWARWSRGEAGGVMIPRDALSLGDGVWDGEGPELTAGPLKAQLPEVQIVNKLHLHRPGSPLDHWEVTAV